VICKAFLFIAGQYAGQNILMALLLIAIGQTFFMLCDKFSKATKTA
jgi:hypothetical protein